MSYPKLSCTDNIVVSVRPDNLDARLKLASVLEELGQKSEALEIVSEVLRIRALESHTTRGRGPTEKPRQSKADKNVTQKLNKRVLENQMRQKMQEFWEEVQMAEAGIMNGDFGSLDRFVAAAGTMIENFRLAKANFSKNRASSQFVEFRMGVLADDIHRVFLGSLSQRKARKRT